MNLKPLHVGIIGGGASGLVTLKELLAEGHDGIVFEKSDVIGGLFQTVYQQGYMVSSNVVTMFSDFVGLEQDKNDLLEKPRMWSFIEYSKYLNDYAEHFRLRPYIKFQTCVQSVWKNVTTNKWNIKVKSVVDEKEAIYTFDRIAVCSGTHQKRNMPSFKGQHLYKGTIKHLQDIRKYEDFTDKRLCIVGSGEGGSDITLAAAKYGKKTYLSIRKDHGFILPRYPNGPFYPSDLGTTRAIHSIPRAHGLLHTYLYIFFNLIASYIKGIRTVEDKVQRASLYMNLKQIKTSNWMNTYGTKNTSFVEAMVEYKCERKPAIKELTEHKVTFDDGTEEEIDEIVCCTGFISEFSFLEIGDKQADPMHAELVRKVAYDARIPHDLYKHCVHPHFGDELFFIGFVRPAFGAIPPLAEMQARWYALLCSNKLALPDKETMIEESKTYVKYIEWQLTPYRTNRIVNLTDFVIYSDDLARTIGCRPHLVKMFFSDPSLWLKCMCGPIMNAQYRLVGPHSKSDQARQIIKQVRWLKHLNLVSLFLLYVHAFIWFCGLKSHQPSTWYPISAP